MCYDGRMGTHREEQAVRRVRARRATARLGSGFALPVVLIVVAAMSVLALRIVDQSRTGTAIARAQLDEAIARHAADAGVEIFIVTYVGQDYPLVPPAFETTIGTARVTVSAQSELGKIDLNVGDPVLLEGVLRSVGADAGLAGRAAREIVEFRSQGDGQVFHSVDELLRVASVGPALLDRVRPFLTVYGAVPGIDARVAPRPVLLAVPGITQALADQIIAARESDLPLPPAAQAALEPYRVSIRPVYTVRSSAELAGRASFTREAVIDLGLTGAPVVLSWLRRSAGEDAGRAGER
jgi:general secretion pathway protein K